LFKREWFIDVHLAMLIGTRQRLTRANKRAGAPSGGEKIALSALLVSRPVILLDLGSNFEITS